MRNPIAVTAGLVLTATGVLGWLLWPSPPSATTLHAGTPHYAITATVASPRIGSTDVTIDVSGGDATAVTVEAVMPLMGFATPPAPALPQGDHRTATGLSLMMTGPWELYLSVTGHDGGTDTAMVPFTVTG